MPIRRELKHHYGKAHQKRAREMKEAVGWECQGCDAKHGTLIERKDGSYWRIVLTLAHVNHDPTDNEPENLRVWCQKCHLKHDRPHHAKSRAENRAKAETEAHKTAGQTTLL